MDMTNFAGVDERAADPVEAAPLRGALILAGSHGAIALARVLKRQGLDVWLVVGSTPFPRYSNAFSHRIDWPGAGDPDAVGFLERLARENGLGGYLLVPAADAEVQLVSEHHERLAATFRLLLPDWTALKWACDKGLAYQRAAELGLGAPQTYAIGSVAEAERVELNYPVVLKPSMRVNLNRFTRDKVWRAEDRQSFLSLYREAAALEGPQGVVVQEMIPGGGECQLSYAGLWWQGRPVLRLVARRTRQYPIEFSYTSTFVETVDDEPVVRAAETFLAAIGHHGPVEIEFKRDPRNGALKLLDVNPRPWSWFGLADAAGLDFGAAIVALCAGRPVAPAMAHRGVGWMFLARDMVAAAQLMLAGRIGPGEYLRSLPRTRTFASFSFADPLPGLLEIPLTVWRVITRARSSKW